MLVAPAFWYERFPGVLESGPLNHHFVRDLGCAFLVAGGAVLYGAIKPKNARGLVAATAALLSLHALVHLSEGILADHPGWRTVDITTVYPPAVLALGCMILWPPYNQ
jgi:hypothetical protein